MFTGIVENVGRVRASGSSSIEVATDIHGLEVGESIAVNGACLTVRALTEGGFVADLSEETARRTTLGGLEAGSRVNLERPLQVGGRFGGHIVQGHVDSRGTVVALDRLDSSVVMRIEIPESLSPYVVEKGSIAVDGVSLTVVEAASNQISVSLIPHTMAATNFGDRAPGDQVNLEVDLVAKYVRRIAGQSSAGLMKGDER